jgi:hypothetical protein
MLAETRLIGKPSDDQQNGIVHIPLAGQPGDNGNGVTYNFNSDAVPEPASIQ